MSCSRWSLSLAPTKQRHDVRWNLLWERRPVGLRRKPGGEAVRDGLAPERAASRKRLVQDAAEGPHVAPSVQLATPSLLRAHVGRRPQNQADRGYDRGLRTVGTLRRGVNRQ